ncbi:hypothetical protein BJX70DRAFT_384396 [Aspergillus crustosus]
MHAVCTAPWLGPIYTRLCHRKSKYLRVDFVSIGGLLNVIFGLAAASMNSCSSILSFMIQHSRFPHDPPCHLVTVIERDNDGEPGLGPVQ